MIPQKSELGKSLIPLERLSYISLKLQHTGRATYCSFYAVKQRENWIYSVFVRLHDHSLATRSDRVVPVTAKCLKQR